MTHNCIINDGTVELVPSRLRLDYVSLNGLCPFLLEVDLDGFSGVTAVIAITDRDCVSEDDPGDQALDVSVLDDAVESC